MKKFYVYALLSIATLSTNKLDAQVDVNDSLALVALFDSTDGPHWLHKNYWLTTNPVSTWYGVDVSATTHRVIELALYQNRLTGQIPAAIGNLTELQYLSLASNQLSGNIPEEIFNCTELTTLALAYNQLAGNIPSSIGNCKKIAYLRLDHNVLSGSLPPEIGMSSGLVSLDVEYNQLSGNIPPEIGNLPILSLLYCGNNKLSGSIPAEIGNLSSLGEIELNNNELSGSIPAEMNNLHTAGYFNLSYNQLSGPIDTELFINNEYIYLDHNQFSGKLPEIGANHFTLQVLSLSHNKLSGTIPGSFINNFRFLKRLNLSNNEFNGSIPPQTGTIFRLRVLDLSHNNLTGAIPEELGNNNNYRQIVLSFNKLQGAIPTSLHNLKKLEKFDVRGNRLNGAVPDFFTKFGRLKSLNILENYFTFDGIEELVSYLPDNVFKYNAQKNIDIHQKGKKLFVYAGGTLSNNTYKWYRDGHLSAKITGDSSFTPTKDGNYTVQVTNSIATELTLFSDTVSFSTGKVLSAIASTTNKNNFSVYPNPAKTYTTVSFNASGNVVLKLSDINGNILQIKNIVAVKGINTAMLNVSGYANGIYFITLIDDKKQAQTLMFSKL